jgi:hypothetical protein
MIGFGGVGFVDIFLDRTIAHDGVLVEFRGVLGVAGVEMVFVFG